MKPTEAYSSSVPVSVVAGGAGFIGSHLATALYALGHEVIVIDNLVTSSKSNIAGLIGRERFSFIELDVTGELPIFERVHHIFHLASPASVIDYQNHPEETALANSVGTVNLLKLAKSYSARFLFASTSEVYGDPKEHPQKETYWGNVNPNGKRACYDESKRYGEMMTMLYRTKHGVNVRIARIFNTYGPLMRPTDGRVVSNFIAQAIRNEPLTVYGDGTQTRSFCYVDDLVDGLVKLMMVDEADGEVVNLGNPEEYRVTDLAGEVIRIAESSSKIVFTELPVDDPVRRKPDITKAGNLLKWKPRVGLEEGLAKTVAWQKTIEKAATL